MLDIKPPYLGCAYYPEDWPVEEIEKDAAKMKATGIQVARIAEFAWSRMERTEGVFTFDWLHHVVDTLAKYGIATVMGTPTATPPIWLSRKYPDVLKENENGRREQHGGRRHCCSNNEHYREYSARIVEKMAQVFADDENVIGWQIDNEIYAHKKGCFCPVCAEKFIRHLKEKFKTVDALNKAWNLTIFSQEYNFFDEIPTPRDAWVNPHHHMEWRIFQQESIVEFVTMQAEILKKYVKVPVGTDVMPANGMNYLNLHKKLDVVQFNHYNEPDNLTHCCLWFDFLRNIKEHPFWNTETSTCWNGGLSIAQTVKPEGFCYVNSWLPIALGGEANMYWLWRTHWGGHELMHGAVLDACGRPMHIYDEVKRIARDYARAGYFLNRTKVTTPIAFHYLSHAANFVDTQGVVQGFGFQSSIIKNYYEPILHRGLRPDFLEAAQDFSRYKVLFTPFVPSLEYEGLGERIRRWVENGGVWVVGPMTDNRNNDGARYKDRPFGMLEDFLGVRWAYAVPDLNNEIKCQWASGLPFTSRLWYELYEKDADALATVAEAPHSALVGKAVAFRKKIGKGMVFLLGTIPSADVMRGNILPLALDAAGLSTGHVGDSCNLMVARREGHGMTGVVVVEYQGKPGRYTLDKPAVELITAHKLEGTIDIKPYQVLVLQE